MLLLRNAPSKITKRLCRDILTLNNFQVPYTITFIFFSRSDEPAVTAILWTPLSRRDWSSTAAPHVLSVQRRRLLPVSKCDSTAAATDAVPVSPSKPQLYAEFKLKPRIWCSSHPAFPVDRVESWPTIPEEQEVTFFQQDQVTWTIHPDFFPVTQVFSLEKKSVVCKACIVVICVKCKCFGYWHPHPLTSLCVKWFWLGSLEKTDWSDK